MINVYGERHEPPFMSRQHATGRNGMHACFTGSGCLKFISIIISYAGLGKKTLAVDHGDTEDLHRSIIDAFPQLSDAGGYELLRLSEVNRRTLELIPVPPSGYSAEYLKECVHQAKVYIRPIQRNLCEDELPSVEVSG